MTISAVIPTYNRRRHVERALASVFGQTRPVDEIIVVDDGSTDGTAAMIESRFGNRVRVVEQANQGVSAARRRAVEESRCEWVAFLDSDDEWTPERNNVLADAVNRVSANVGWIFGDTTVVTDQGEQHTLYEQHALKLDSDVMEIEDTWSVHQPFQFGLLQASLIRRSALVEQRCFHEGLRHSEDYLAGVQVACHYRFAAVASIVTRLHRTSELSASSLEQGGNLGADYFRARMIAYALIAESTGNRNRWSGYYGNSVRGLCKVLASKGSGTVSLAMRQFRYDRSCKAVAFFGAALMGGAGVRFWKSIETTVRSRRERNVLCGTVE